MKYSIEEIDRMRSIVLTLIKPSGNTAIHGTGMDWDSIAEDQLRTYMSNGTSVEELENKLGRR